MADNRILVNLADISDDGFEIKEEKYTYFYQRVYDPDKKKHPNWLIFIMPTNTKTQSEWRLVTSGVLTDEYTVASTEGITDTILKGLKEKCSYKCIHCDLYGSVVSVFTTENMKLNIPADDEVNRAIFKLITGIESDISHVTCNSSLSFTISNSMTGKSALTLNYGMLNEYNQQSLRVNNTYLFPDFEVPLIHDKKLILNFDKATKIKEIFESRVGLFKSIPVNDDFIQEIKKCFPVKVYNTHLLNAWNQFDSELRNLYYLTFLISFAFTKISKIDSSKATKNMIKYIVEKFLKENRRSAVA